jgi:putative membrane protein
MANDKQIGTTEEVERDPEQEKDPRFFLAAERTFLAWIRTGLSLMGFGFVVARFGIFLKEVQITQHQSITKPTGFSVGFGTTLVLIGVWMNVVAAFEHVKTVRKIRRGELLNRPSNVAIAVAILLAVTGLAMAGYLLLVE